MKVRERVARRLSGYGSIAVWGASGLGTSAMARWLPVAKVAYCIDNNPARIGGTLQGKPVVAPTELAGRPVDCIVICSMAHGPIRAQIRALGYRGEVLFIYEAFLPDSGTPMSEIEMLAIDIAATKNDPWYRFVLLKPQVLVNVTFRLTRWAQGHVLLRPLYFLLYFLHAVACVIFAIQLPAETKIGPGLIFAHYGAIVFSARARIGAFFAIYHGCTVGTNDSGQGPQIGDFVTQFAGSHVLGRCDIGSGTRVGANAVALDLKCEPFSTVVGIPARVIQRVDAATAITA